MNPSLRPTNLVADALNQMEVPRITDEEKARKEVIVLDWIKQKTGDKENSCTCKNCVRACKTNPCIGTPYDILRLLKAGYGHRLRPTEWAVMRLVAGEPSIHLLAPKQRADGSCTFFRNGFCELHTLGLKPTEGKLMNCKKKTTPELNLAHAVARTWDMQMNAPVMYEILDELQNADTKLPDK